MFGGYNGEDSFHNIEIFDIETFKWTIPETKGSFPSYLFMEAFVIIFILMIFIYSIL